MIVFNTPRAGRQDPFYMEKLIKQMWNAENSVFKKGYGMYACDSFNVVNAFQAIQNVYQKAIHVKVHYMEIYVGSEVELSMAITVADKMGQFFFEQGYQCFITVVKESDYYLIGIVVNAVSYVDGKTFHDNNKNYWYVYRYLTDIVSRKTKVTASEHTFFDPQIGTGNYVHGKFY